MSAAIDRSGKLRALLPALAALAVLLAALSATTPERLPRAAGLDWELRQATLRATALNDTSDCLVFDWKGSAADNPGLRRCRPLNVVSRAAEQLSVAFSDPVSQLSIFLCYRVRVDRIEQPEDRCLWLHSRLSFNGNWFSLRLKSAVLVRSDGLAAAAVEESVGRAEEANSVEVAVESVGDDLAETASRWLPRALKCLSLAAATFAFLGAVGGLMWPFD